MKNEEKDKFIFVEVDMDSRVATFSTTLSNIKGNSPIVRGNVPDNVKLVYYDNKHGTSAKIIK